MPVLLALWSLACNRAPSTVADAFSTILSDKGRDSFKLADLCKANSIDNGTSHDAITDCLNTVALAEIVYKKTPEIWNAALSTTSH